MTQCSTCVHFQRRGGALFEPREQCCALEDDHLQGRVEHVLVAICEDLATRGRCPFHEQGTDHPDAYRSEDLPLKGKA